MRVLVIRSGGREHALQSSIAAAPLRIRLWRAPGNSGTVVNDAGTVVGARFLAALSAADT